MLRFVYRLLILFVAEDREILFDPAAGLVARQRYAQYYSTDRLRRMAGLRLGTRHADLFRMLWLVMEQLGSEVGCQALGLPALNGFLFSSQRAVPDLIGCELENASLLVAVHALAFTEEKGMRRTVDYKNLGSEELGSVEVARLARQYQFFHWHIACPEVFSLPAHDAAPENAQAGWSGGFGVVLGNLILMPFLQR